VPDPSRTQVARTETDEVGDRRVIRHYHQNGRLVRELKGKLSEPDFVYDGESRQWSSEGDLIGSFTMSEGTGVFRDWYDNGQICSEMSMVDGKLMGLLRAWDETGYLLAEHFYCGFKRISKKKYRELQTTDPSAPQYPENAFLSITQKRKLAAATKG
jgi:antitoxin component YwqK of YwqJK toxin-antitoxin module